MTFLSVPVQLSLGILSKLLILDFLLSFRPGTDKLPNKAPFFVGFLILLLQFFGSPDSALSSVRHNFVRGVILEVLGRNVWVIELFVGWNDVSIQVVIFLGFNRVENECGSKYTSDIIV